jgi:hypothetical protein
MPRSGERTDERKETDVCDVAMDAYKFDLLKTYRIP